MNRWTLNSESRYRTLGRGRNWVCFNQKNHFFHISKWAKREQRSLVQLLKISQWFLYSEFVAEESQQTGFKTSYAPTLGFLGYGLSYMVRLRRR
jgi:hypothetical protein